MSHFMRQRYSVENFSIDGECGVSADDLLKINRLKKNGPLKKLKADDVFVRRMIVLGEEPTSKLSVHPENDKLHVLTDLSKTLIGCPMMEGHRVDRAPWGRIFSAEVLSGVSGYNGSVLKISYYFLAADDGMRRAARIDGGIDAEGSISYRFRTAHCSICDKKLMVGSWMGMSMNEMKCEHVLGNLYDGKRCCWYPQSLEAYEVSMVFKGAYGKTKSLLTVDEIPKTIGELVAAYSVDEAEAVELGLSDAVIAQSSVEADSSQKEFFDQNVKPLKKLSEEHPQNVDNLLITFETLVGKYEITPAYEAIYAILSKYRSNATLTLRDGKDVSEKFPHIIKEANEQLAEEFVLHGKIVKYRGRRRGNRKDVEKYINSADLNDHGFRFKPFEITHLNNGKNVDNFVDNFSTACDEAQFSTKHCNNAKFSCKAAMKSISSGVYISPVKSQTANGGEEVVRLVTLLATKEGAFIKSLDGGGDYRWVRKSSDCSYGEFSLVKCSGSEQHDLKIRADGKIFGFKFDSLALVENSKCECSYAQFSSFDNSGADECDLGKCEVVTESSNFCEVVLHGKDLSGRYVFQKLGEEKSVWVSWKPKNQEPLSETEKIDYTELDGGVVLYRFS